jgi:hypothetical protein
MKYIWEAEDIKPGVKVKHFSGTIYTVVTVDTREVCDAGLACYREDQHQVSPMYTVEEIVEIFNTQGCVPISG